MRRASSEPPLIRGFTFVRELGAGGFSDVFLYEQELPRRRVAVKVLLAGELTAAARASFVAEANAMATLSAHPYIVSIFHADVSDDGRPYFIMEYYGGPSLADAYKAQPLPVADALRVGIRLASAIATAHASGLLHRDIKPANVLTNDYANPGLTDFGISSAVEDELPLVTTTRAALDETGGTSGSQSVGLSVPWSPPEMFDDDPKPDVRSDVFSLAATIYTLLAGRTPFEVAGGPNQANDLMSRIERGAITPLTRTDVPASFVAVLRKGMAVDRSQRFATAVDFARALQRVELELQYSATPIEVPNLAVPEAQRPAAGDPADETRARAVTTIAAQPAAAAPAAPAAPPAPAADQTRARATPIVAPHPAAPGPAVSAAPVPVAPAVPVAEHTVVRGRQGASSVAPVAPTQTPPQSPRPPRRVPGVLVALIVGLVAVLAVVFGVAVLPDLIGGTPDAKPTDAAVDNGDDDSPVINSGVPTPVAGTVTISPDGTVYTFTWTNPDPADGDVYSWIRTDRLGETEPHDTGEPTAVISGIEPGTAAVCIDISIFRSGRPSPTVRECSP